QPCNSNAACNAAGACSNLSTAVTVLDSPKNIGRLPVGQPDAVTFSVQTGAGPFAPGAKVYLRLDLTATGAPKDLSRTNFEFVHPLGTDKTALHYSTDFPGGSGVITRDLNRSLVIEPNDRPGLTLGSLDETIQFSSLFTVDTSAGGTGVINNQIKPGDEAYPPLGIFTPGATGDGGLDRHVLARGGASARRPVPLAFRPTHPPPAPAPPAPPPP